MALNGSGVPLRCAECDHAAFWTIARKGDAAISWSCSDHFSTVALHMQRDHEITELVVKHTSKSLEWAEINASLRDVLNEGKIRHYCGGYFLDEYLCPLCHMPTGNPRRND